MLAALNPPLWLCSAADAPLEHLLSTGSRGWASRAGSACTTRARKRGSLGQRSRRRPTLCVGGQSKRRPQRRPRRDQIKGRNFAGTSHKVPALSKPMERYLAASVPFMPTKGTIYSKNEVPLAGTAPFRQNIHPARTAVFLSRLRAGIYRSGTGTKNCTSIQFHTV